MDNKTLDLCNRYCEQWCCHNFIGADLCREMANLLDTLTDEQQYELSNFLDKKISEINKTLPPRQWPTFITPSI